MSPGELRSQLKLHHLARGIQRERVDDPYRSRDLEVRHVIATPAHDLVRVDDLPGAGSDECLPALAEPLTGDADDRHLSHPRMADHDALDLGGIGVEAAHD